MKSVFEELANEHIFFQEIRSRTRDKVLDSALSNTARVAVLSGEAVSMRNGTREMISTKLGFIIIG